jgi:serine/threonine protein kinase/tetratricopeptide (TPR) repeat protein
MAAAFQGNNAGATADYPNQQAGMVIAGKYTLVEVIGEGGMGSVWRAKQTEPVKRFVALKLIKAGMDSKQVLARFEAERQALALMDHPNIAKVLDGGLHEYRPFFVMELVKGVPITNYCDAHKLTPKERLELFVPVCQAIQHAHQKGIIHRDIKPRNVLIALYDDKPVVKVIDFGVAKATGGTLTERTIDTGFAGVVGTPQYMSPEQATFNNLDIDTRSDVYALGVLLYELLTGTTPFARKDLEKKGLLEILRVVREEEPPRPSTKLSTADALPTLSANRGTEPKKLTGLLRNELDWIVMKALEKDRTRRYETANGIAADVQRYLSGEAVQAHPPSTAYRVKKFVRRHKGQVIAVGLLLLTLVGGIIGTTWGLLEANHQAGLALEEASEKEKARQAAVNETAEKVKALKAEAEQRQEADKQRKAATKAQEKAELEKVIADKERRAAVEARNEADRQRALADEVNQFLQSDLLRQADSQFQSRSRFVPDPDLTVRKALDRAAARIGDRFKNQPLVEAGIRMAIGNAYVGVGQAKLAVSHLQRALELRQKHLGIDERDTVITMHDLAHALNEAGQTKRALDLLRNAVKLQEAKLGLQNADTLTVRNTLAFDLFMTGQTAQGLQLAEETLALWEKTAPNDGGRLDCMDILAQILLNAGQPKRALAILNDLAKIADTSFGPDDSRTLTIQTHLGLAYDELGQYDRAATLFEKLLTITRKQMGPDHPSTLYLELNLGGAWMRSGRGDDAIPLLEKTLAKCKDKMGIDHHGTLRTMNNLAVVYRMQGEIQKATDLLQLALEGRLRRDGPEHPDTVGTMANLADVYMLDGRLDEAVSLAEKARHGWLKQPVDHPGRMACLNTLAVAYGNTGRVADAARILQGLVKQAADRTGVRETQWRNNLKEIPLIEKLWEPYHKAVAEHGPNHRITQHERLQIAETFLDLERPALAEYHFRKLLDAWGAKDAPFEPALISVLVRLAEIQTLKRRHTEAEKLALRGLAICAKHREPEKFWPANWTKSVLGGSLTGQKKYAEAEKLVLAGCEGLRAVPPPEPYEHIMPGVFQRVIDLYDAWGKKDEAAKWRTEQERYTGKLIGPVHEVGAGLELKGQLDAQTTALAYQVKLVPGKTYVIDMVSADQKALDPYLVLSDAAGKKLAEDDDAGGGLNARIIFRADRDGAFRIRATSFNAGRGAFTLTVREQRMQSKDQK